MIGIDHYWKWSPLTNAVSDAHGVLATFEQLGFEGIGEPLLEARATRDAMHRLVVDELRVLGPEDSLVLFFAGHGHTIPTPFPSGGFFRNGYIIPVDADAHDGSHSTWVRLDSWLSDVARLPARHILVILDACNSGIALDHVVIRHRGGSLQTPAPIEHLRARRSRRVMTSALDDQRAQDNGPRPQHSLFTGCLLDALVSGLAPVKPRLVTGSDIWTHVRGQVMNYPGSQQTPDFGALELDDRGELVLELPGRRRRAPVRKLFPPSNSAAKIQSGSARLTNIRKNASGRESPTVTNQKAVRKPPVSAPHPGNVLLDARFVATLDRHAAERLRGISVLSIIEGDARSTLSDWGAWAAGCGYLTLVTEGVSLDAAIAELLTQTPWLRCLGEARRRLAKAANLEVDAIEAEIDARSGTQRRAWIDENAGSDARVRVSGWLLSAIRESRGSMPDLSTAPAKGGALLSILCELATPIAVILHRTEPTAAWLERAVSTAASLIGYLPGHPIAVSAPSSLVSKVLDGGRQSSGFAMARQGRVSVAARKKRPLDREHSRHLQMLHDALNSDPRMARLFTTNVSVSIPDGGSPVTVDLAVRSARFAVVIDSWYQVAEPQLFRLARASDERLQRAGFFVMRFLDEDIEQRLALVVNEIALCLSGRLAASTGSGDY